MMKTQNWTSETIFTLSIAFAGLILGAFSLWLQFSQWLVLLRITFRAGYETGGDKVAAAPVRNTKPDAIASFLKAHMYHSLNKWVVFVEILNLSAFPVTLQDAGVLDSIADIRKEASYRLNKAGKIVHSITDPHVLERGPWPRCLEPRSNITLRLPVEWRQGFPETSRIL